MSWEQLRSITLADRQEREFWAAEPPRSCPNDGTPLQSAVDGSLRCSHDGYQWPRDPALPGEGGNV